MLNKEQIEIVERAVAARMGSDIDIVKLEIADHLITDIEARMSKDNSITFYNALKCALRNYGGEKQILKVFQSKLIQSQKEITIRTVRSANWVEIILSFLLLLFLLCNGFAEQTNLHRVYFASMIPVAYVIYKRIAHGNKQLLVDGLLCLFLLPYSLISTCLSSIKEYDSILTVESYMIAFILTYVAIFYMLLRHRAVYQMMTEEIELTRELKQTV